MQNFFDMLKDMIGFRQRASRRSVVVQDKSPFVHLGEEASVQRQVADDRENDDASGTCKQDPGTFQHRFHRSAIKVHDAAEKAGKVGFFGSEKGRNVRTARGSSC